MTSNRANSGSLLKKYNIELTRSLGQNLLTDRNIASKIARFATAGPPAPVVEIGPGCGALTVPLAELAESVTAIEIDSRLIPALEEALCGMGNVHLINADFMKYDLAGIGRPWKVCGNLPYNITTPIIMKLIEQDNLPERMTFLVQKEAADRLAAAPGGKERGAVSVLVQYVCNVEKLMDVGRTVFYPKPNVDSAVIALTPKKIARLPGQGSSKSDDGYGGDISGYGFFKEVVRTAFSQRRKMIKAPLAGIVPDRAVLAGCLEAAGVPGTARAETLTVEQFIKLSETIKQSLI